MTSLTQVLLEADRTGIEPTILVVGDRGIGKTTLIKQFNSEEETVPAMTTNINEVRCMWHGRTVRFIDTPGHVTATNRNDPTLPFNNSDEYVDFIATQLAGNAPQIQGPKIHVVLLCFQNSFVEAWHQRIITVASTFARVMAVKLNCSAPDDLGNLRTLMANSNIPAYAVLAKDKRVNGNYIPAFGMAELASAMADELSIWQRNYQELVDIFNRNQTAYYDNLKEKGLTIVKGFGAAGTVAGLSPIPFTNSAASIASYIGMFLMILGVYGVKSSRDLIRTIAISLFYANRISGALTVAGILGVGCEIMKCVPILNGAGMVGAASLNVIATLGTGSAFLYVIDRKCREGMLEITRENQQRILDEIISARNNRL